jgi:hypothetical protein
VSEELESLILPLQREMRPRMATKPDLDVLRARRTELEARRVAPKSDLELLRGKLVSDLLTVRTEPSGRNADLTRPVIDCHAMFLDQEDCLTVRLDRRERRRARPGASPEARLALCRFPHKPNPR